MKKKLYFKYRVKDDKGRYRSGRAAAGNPAAVRRLLEGKGYSIISIVEEKSVLSRFSFGKVSAKDRSVTYRELATMLKAGVAITQAIDIVSETPNKKMKKTKKMKKMKKKKNGKNERETAKTKWNNKTKNQKKKTKKKKKKQKDIHRSLENGFALSVAMAGQPKIFPEVEIGVIRAGEATGNLSKVLDDLSVSTARSAEFIGKVRGAMIYPSFIFVVMIIVGAIILTKVIPPIKEIFASSDSELPATTQLLLSITDVIINSWQYIILKIMLLSIVVCICLKSN